jgi:hypothetical protein
VHISEEDKGSRSGGGENIAIVDGIAWMKVGNYLGPLTKNVRRRWTYPPFEPPLSSFLIKRK